MAVSVAAMSAFARKVVRGNTGYSQARRWSFYDRARNVFIANQDTDCSAFCGAIAKQGTGKVNLGVDHAGFYTGNFEQHLVATGEFQGWPYAGAAVREGDFLLKPGHVAYAVSPSFIAEAYIDENGQIMGGKPGAQAAWETRIVTNYGGWTRLIRPKTISTNNEEDELNSTEKRQLQKIYDFVTSPDGAKMPVRMRKMTDYVTLGGPDGDANTVFKKILTAVTDALGVGSGVRSRNIQDLLSGGGPKGEAPSLLRDILTNQELILARLDKLEGK